MLDRVFLQVLNMSIISSFVILFIFIARLVLRRAPKVFSYALWSAALFRLVCPVSFESVLSLLPLGAEPIPADIMYAQTPQIDVGIAAINDAVNASLPAGMPFASANPLQLWITAGAAVWLAGIAVLFIYSIVALLQLKKRVSCASCEQSNIYLVKNLETPFVMGVFRPRIYLPELLACEEKRYILLHEQTHIQRLDHLLKLLAFAALCIHWFNPLVWAAFFACGRDMEMSCDERVIRQLGNDVKKEYSSSLLALAAGKRKAGGVPLAFGEGDTRSRIRNVLHYKKPARWVSFACAAAVAAFCLALAADPDGSSSTEEVVQGYVQGSIHQVAADYGEL